MIDSKNELILGIQKSAAAKQQKIVENARRSIKDKRTSIDLKCLSLTREAKKQAETKAEKFKKKEHAALAIEIKKMRLNAQKQIHEKIEQQVRQKISELLKTADYKKVLQNLLIDALLGLRVEEARVSCSEEEKVFFDGKFLKETEKIYREKTGSKLKLSLETENTNSAQGVMVISADGRLAYNNQFAERLRRFSREIQKIINRKLFEESNQDSQELI